jgi:hypothetical protein
MFKSSKNTVKFLFGFLFVFLKNLFFYLYLSDLIYSYISVGLDFFVFWLLVPNVKNRIIYLVLSVISILFLCFFKKPILAVDNDNHLLKFLAGAVPFVFHIFITRNRRRIIIPFIMGLAMLVNLELALHFTGNISLYNLILNELPASIITDGVFLAWLKALFLSSLIIIFYELDHQFFAWKSFRLYVEQQCNKRTLAILFLIFKPLMYWFIGSLILVFLGQNRIPIFENKLSLLSYGLTFGSFLFIYAVYFRKFISIYFYENLGINNFLYVCLALPFVDVFAFAILLIFKNFQLKKWFNFKWKSLNLVYFQMAVLLAYMVYYYVTILKDLPTSNADLLLGAYSAYVGVPAMLIICLWFAKNNANLYRYLILTLMLAGLVLRFAVLPKIETSLDVKLLMHLFLNYFLILLAVFFIYPFLFLKNYLKIKD